MTAPGNGPLVLIIEDEPRIRRFLRASLEENGFRVDEAGTGKEGLGQATSRPPDLVVLDLGLPDIDGLEVTRQLRDWSSVPILVLSARGQETDKVKALDLGADDYVTKPFGVGEVLARIRVALRHVSQAGQKDAQPIYTAGDLKIDLENRRVFVGPKEVRLTPIEYRLLATLIRHAGKVLTHTFLLKEVWGPDGQTEVHTLRVFMANLRHKIEENPSRPRYLLTEPGVGYRLAEE